MAWTDERVDLLKKLWTEGLSASQIANRLGGVTRNAVIGKVHRLGLSGRATTSRVKPVRPRKRVAKTNSSKLVRSNNKYTTTTSVNAKQALEPRSAMQNEVVSRHYEELFIPLEERKTILTLKENNCRWPIGDPTDEDFHFCGKTRVPGSPYCDHHACVAFQPVQSKRSKAARPQLKKAG